MKSTFIAAAAALVASAAATPTFPIWGSSWGHKDVTPVVPSIPKPVLPSWSGEYNELKCKLLHCEKLCYLYPSLWLWPLDSACRIHGCQRDCSYPETSPSMVPASPSTVTETQAQATITQTQAQATVTQTQAQATVTQTQAQATVTQTQAQATVTQTQAQATITQTQAQATVTSVSTLSVFTTTKTVKRGTQTVTVISAPTDCPEATTVTQGGPAQQTVTSVSTVTELSPVETVTSVSTVTVQASVSTKTQVVTITAAPVSSAPAASTKPSKSY